MAASPSDSSLAGLAEAMDRYVDGDPRAFTRLHELLVPRLRAFLIRLLGGRQTVDDLVQVTLLKAHLARERFEVQGGNADAAVQAWYFAIARNAAMDHLRSHYRRERRELRGDGDDDPLARLADPEPTIEEIGLSREREAAIVDQVQAAIARLPAGQREVVELHKLAGLSMAEIAERLAIREGAVRVRAHRAYKALAQWLVPTILIILWSWP